MTLANSSSKLKLFLLTCRNRLWLFVLGLVVFLFALPVTSGLILQNRYSGLHMTAANGNNAIHDLLRFDFGVSVGVMCVAALLCGIVCFRYLHRRKQVDFYHSMPLKRGEWFAINYLSGLAVFVVCYAVATIINSLVIALSAFSAYMNWWAYLQDILLVCLFYFVFYTMVVFAMNLTGTILTAVLTVGFINAILPALIGFKELCFELFFSTYLSLIDNLESIMINSSPFAKMFEMCVYNNVTGKGVIAFVILGVVLLVLAFVLNIKRASESAGAAFVFRPIGLVMKMVISFVGVCYFAMFFYVTGQQRLIWLIFGAVAGAALAYNFLSIWFSMDFKSILRKKNWIGAAVVCVAVMAVYAGFIMDVTNYDEYLPDAEKVAGVSIDISNIDYYAHDTNGAGGDFWDSEYNYMLYNRMSKDKWQITDAEGIKAAIAIADKGIDWTVERSNMLSPSASVYSYGYEDIHVEPATEQVHTARDELQYTSVHIIYTLDNGKQVGRYYSLPLNVITNEVLAVVDTDEYRDNQFLAHQFIGTGKVYFNYAENFGANNYSPETMSLAERAAIAEIFLKEHRNLSLEARKTEVPVGRIEMSIYPEEQPDTLYAVTNDGRYYSDESDELIWVRVQYPVYAEFTETIAAINKAAGYDVFADDLDQVMYVEEFIEGNFYKSEDYKAQRQHVYQLSNQVGRISEQLYYEMYGDYQVVNYYDDPAYIRELYEQTVPVAAGRYNGLMYTVYGKYAGVDYYRYKFAYENGSQADRRHYVFMEF